MDTNIIIATGRSRSARSWKSQKMTWSALANKLAEPTVKLIEVKRKTLADSSADIFLKMVDG